MPPGTRFSVVGGSPEAEAFLNAWLEAALPAGQYNSSRLGPSPTTSSSQLPEWNNENCVAVSLKADGTYQPVLLSCDAWGTNIGSVCVFNPFLAGNGLAAVKDGPAFSASFLFDTMGSGAMAVDYAAGMAYVIDGHRVRAVDTSTGHVRTVAGTEEPGTGGDGGPGTAAQLSSPQGLCMTARKQLVITEGGSLRLRILDLRSGIIST